jgi:hypothetical protein
LGLPVGLAGAAGRANPICLIEKKLGPELPEFRLLANDDKKIAKKLQKKKFDAL